MIGHIHVAIIKSDFPFIKYDQSKGQFVFDQDRVKDILIKIVKASDYGQCEEIYQAIIEMEEGRMEDEEDEEDEEDWLGVACRTIGKFPDQ